MHDDTTTSQNLSRCSKNYRHKEQIHLRHESKAGDQKVQRGIFKLCENSAKLQCPHCNSFTEIGIIYRSCGRNLKCKRSPTTTRKAICDYSSIPRLVIKKNSSRGTKHGQSERQIMFCKAKQMLKKARQEKHGIHPTILSRWYE